MKLGWKKWTVRIFAVAGIVLSNVLIGCDCGGGNGNGSVAVGGATRFTITDLGAGSTFTPTGINNSTQIVGNAIGPGAANSGGSSTQPVFWENGVLTPLQSLNGPNDAANAINDAGQIIGHAGGAALADPSYHAVIWTNSKSAPTALALPAGDASFQSDASALNSKGDVVGIGLQHSGGTHGIVWLHGASNGIVLSGLSGASDTFLTGVNDSGQAVGACDFITANTTSTAVLFNINQPGAAQDIGIVTGNALSPHVLFFVNSPLFVNATGTIVGTTDPSPSPRMGLGAAYVRQPNGKVTQLTALPNQSEAVGINASGTVVLNINPEVLSGPTPPACAIWDMTNGLRDLNALVPSGSGWLLQFAAGINDKGQIIGTGQLNGVTHAFLLTPKP